ncbi:hypothetical protein B0H19DRAFT_1298464 [Mycena capillaripes]|nr:hypothetical protein B0H19DRAFT_1298464 [Mycena capillaripes]
MATKSSTGITLPETCPWDDVLDHLHNAPADLKSLALVCRAFAPRVQMHLFCSVKVESARSRPWHSTQTHSHCHQSMPAARLTQLLSQSPHLIAHIRNLYIGNCSIQTLTSLEQIPWSHLHAIFFVGSQSQESQQPEVLALIGSLVSLPTVRKLAFHSMFWEPSHLHTVLSRCTTRVHSLTFESCFLPTTPNDVPAAPSPSHLPLITSLVLFVVEGEFLSYNALPIDLSGLAHVTLHQNTIPALETVLYTCRHTIRSLNLNGSEPYVASLDLNAFPALSRLTLGGIDIPLRKAFERSWIIPLETISYRLLWVGWEKNLRQLESILSAAEGKMPALRRVEITMVVSGMGRGRGPQTDAEWRDAIEQKMPQLRKRGILAIEVVDQEE